MKYFIQIILVITLLFLATGNNFAMESPVENVYSNLRGSRLELLKGNAFIYLLSNNEQLIKIEGSYDYMRRNNRQYIQCVIKSRNFFEKKIASGHFYLNSQDTLNFRVPNNDIVYMDYSFFSNSERLAMQPLYKVKSKNKSGKDEYYYISDNHDFVYSQSYKGNRFVVKCFTLDLTKSYEDSNLNWSIEISAPINNSKQIKVDERLYTNFSLKAELESLKMNYNKASLYYDSCFLHNTTPLNIDLYNSAVTYHKANKLKKAISAIEILIANGVSVKEIYQQYKPFKRLIYSNKGLNDRLEKIEQFGKAKNIPLFNSLYEHLVGKDQYYRRGGRYKKNKHKIRSIDSIIQEQLISFYQNYGYPLESTHQSYYKNGGALASNMPTMVINIHNTYYKDYKLKKWINIAHEKGRLRSDITQYLIDLESSRLGKKTVFGTPLIYKIRGKYYHKKFGEEELNRINDNRDKYGFLNYNDQKEYNLLYLQSKKTNTPFLFKNSFVPIKWTGVDPQEVCKMLNLEPLKI